ncbi:hypothetical protein MT349_19305 [Rathayibacter caricis]|uniref:hypothetical protein n=1 Tax=Rathayibacter caricis TaxID=110936 RepID=UPI001FB3CC4B|nr:hypothetical protein [Rathayibacter caricis]MCJ1697935.1 hypothetical protein [Rathayibacter caricis]
MAYSRHTWRFRFLGRGWKIRLGNRRMWTWIGAYLLLIGWHATYLIGQDDPFDFAWRSPLWSLVFAAAAGTVFWLSHTMTQGFLGITVPVWESLTSRGRKAYENWYERRRSGRDQLIWGFVSAVATGVALGFVQGAVEAEGGWLIIVPASYGVVVLTGFVVGAAAYWAAWGIWLCTLLSRRGHLRLYRLGPAYTPGVEELSRLLLNTASAGIFVVAALLTPVLIGTANLVDQRLDGVRGVLIGICAATLVGVAVVPQLTLSRAIRESRRSNLRRLTRQYDELEERAQSAARGRFGRVRRLLGRDADGERVKVAEEIERLAGSPTSTIGSGNTVQILASTAGILAPTVLGIVIQARG